MKINSKLPWPLGLATLTYMLYAGIFFPKNDIIPQATLEEMATGYAVSQNKHATDFSHIHASGRRLCPALSQTGFDALIHFYADSIYLDGKLNIAFFKAFDESDWIKYFQAVNTAAYAEPRSKYNHLLNKYGSSILELETLFGEGSQPSMTNIAKEYQDYGSYRMLPLSVVCCFYIKGD